MEDTEVSLHGQGDLLGQMESAMAMMQGQRGGPRTISTRHMLFIVSGAFDSLPEIIRRRLQGSSIGFGAGDAPTAHDDAAWLRRVGTRDLVDYGFEPEFVGRLPVRVVCEPLSESDLAGILTGSEGSILEQYVRDFQGYGIELSATPEALRAVARQAHQEGTGARGLMTVFERVLRPFKFELPSTAIKTLTVAATTVADPEAELANLLRDNEGGQRRVLHAEVTQFADRFTRDHGFLLLFRDEAIAALVAEALASGKTMRALCEEKFRDFHYAMDLAARAGAPRHLEVTAEVVAEPGMAASRWVREALARRDSGAAPAPPATDTAT